MGFPDDADLGTRVEISPGGHWTDITPDSRLAQIITITRGKTDEESTRDDPSAIALEIRNPDGRYSPRNPTGPYYGKLGRNTPLRVSVAAGTPWLGLPPSGTDVRASTASTTALNIAGDLDIRFDVRPDDWNAASGVVELGAKWGSAGQRSWYAYLFAGFVEFQWSTDGTTSTTVFAALGTVKLLPRMVIRITMDVDNGASGHTVRFYGGPTLAGPWTQIGTDQITAGTTATFASSAPVEFGDVSSTNAAHVPARMYSAQIRSGIDGTIVANPSFTAQPVGATSWTDSAGVPWTVNRSDGITNRQVRGIGEVPSWPQRWGTSGQLVTVGLEAAGILRRLGQGASPLQSTLRRRIPSDPNLIAYWPMEDGQSAVQAYSPLAGVRPMITSGLAFASDDSLAGSSALPTTGSTAAILGIVPSSTSTAWRIEFVYRVDTLPAGDANAPFITVTTSNASWRIGIGATTLHIDVTTGDGVTLHSSAWIPTGFSGDWRRFIIRAQQSGGSVAFQVAWIGIGTPGLAVDASYTGSVGRVASVSGSYDSSLQGLRIGHAAVFNVYDTAIFTDADTGFTGEPAAQRFVRLASEEGVPFRVPYGILGTEPMGPQRPDTLLNLLQQAADSDEGAILHEPRESISLTWRPRYSLYNQNPALTLDYAQRQVAPPLEPEDDDQRTRNDITVSRSGGSAEQATLDEGPLSVQAPPAGVGRYTDSVTLSLADDGQAVQHAWWRLHIGTFDGIRYPAVTVYLHRNPELIDQASSLDLGDRLRILNPPDWLPPDPIDLIVQGVTEEIGVRTWVMTFACVPAGPWTVGVVGDSVLGRIPSGTSALAAAVSSTDTVLPVVSEGTALWTQNVGQYPFDLLVGGERVTATACAPWISDSFSRTVTGGWGTAPSGQAWSASGGSSSDFSTTGTTGRHSLGSINVARATVAGSNIADADVVCSFSTSVLAAGASQVVYVLNRWTGIGDFMAARIEFTTTAQVIISIRKRVAGVDTELVTKTTTLTHVANTMYRMRYQAFGSAFQAKVWLASGTEPYPWDVTVTDSSITAAGQVGVRSALVTGNTNTLPVTATFDDFALLNPQALTVVRSANGVVKTQAAGAPVDLFTAMTIPL